MGGLTRYNIGVSLPVCLGGFTYGFGFAVFVTSIGQPGFYTYFELDESSNYTASILGAVNALFALGAALGALAQGVLADWVGRRKALGLAATCAAIGGALTAGSVHIAMLITVRILQGFGLGLIICLVSLYLTEVAPADSRGLLSSMTVCSLGAGYLVCDLVAVGCYTSTNETLQWRLPLALACVGPVGLLLSLFYVPESPRYLAWVDRHEEAWVILQKLHHDPNDPTQSAARAELSQITRQVAFDKKENSTWVHMFVKPSLRRRAVLVILLGMASQSTGVLGITNFIIVIFNGLGITGILPLVLLVGYSICGNASAWVNAFILDRVGRRRMLLVGFPAVATVLLVEAVLQSQFLGTDHKGGQIVCLVFIFLFIITYQITEAPIFVWAAEVFPTTFRAKGIGLMFFSYSIGAIVWTAPAGVALQNVKWGLYLIWMGLCLLCTALVYFFVPETTRLPMEEIAALFGDTVVAHLSADGHNVIEDEGKDTVFAEVDADRKSASEHLEETK